ncbi:hypothetical protein L1987_39150 [Smallanthus sonchifolius]|uniref:Uncharacterized protein n=1 Tax=Smallanthus sonchifolius TaxID=185202 RepID=A0ACB9HKM1_9ASTR|nr:hypothetical protein L1987_39150 [Smallanthus sonchifolius]
MLCSTYLPLLTLCTISTLKTCTSLNLSIVPFNEAFSPLFSNQNVTPSYDGKYVQIAMNQWSTSGSGFVSRYTYNHGLFTASIKLPNSYSAGVVATFYLQNNELMRDEIDFEFLGHIEGEKWYSLEYGPDHFFLDQLPIRELNNVEGMGGDFPSNPMYVYGTIWDGSNWATHNGQYRVDIQRGPFVTGYSFVINGCRVVQFGSMPSECNVTIPSGILSSAERQQMNWYRFWCMTYSCCNDVDRYPNSLPECGVEGPGMQLVERPTFGASRRFV